MDQEANDLDALLADLDASDPETRNASALDLYDFAETEVESILRALARPANRNHRGTLVHVLSAFNCRNRFPELFELAMNGNYEVQCAALTILRRQTFSTTEQQFREAEETLAQVGAREGLSAEAADLLRDELRSVLSRLTPV